MKKITFVLLFAVASAFAQPEKLPMDYWGKTDAMLQDQAALLFEQAHTVLDKYPPSADAGDERKLALFAMDALLHDARLDATRAMTNYVERRFRHVADKLETEKPGEGEIRVHKLYNHGYVIATPSVAIGVDIFRGGRRAAPAVGDDIVRSIVDQCDILFITHAHGDHADKAVTRMFCDQGKTVVAPPGLWEADDLSPKITYLRGEETVTEVIRIPSKNTELTTRVFPGHQNRLPNNLYAITTPEGVTVMHTGDQYNGDDMKWIARVGDEVVVDVLLVHCWMPELEKSIEGIKPKLVITGHENELGHGIDHREPYWLTFRRFADIRVPWVVLAWGESFLYP